jgi:hypothetical protein
VKEPECDGPECNGQYTVAVANACYQGCVRKVDCAP